MINITKHGFLPQKKKYEFKCKKCGCEFNCWLEDMKYCSNWRNEPATYSIECPTVGCNQILHMEEE